MNSPPTPSGPTRRQWIVLVCLFLLSLPAVTTRIYSSDEIQYFAYLRSMWFDRDLSFENEYRHFYDRGIAKSAGFHETFLERQTDTGRRINFGTVGCAILWAPFYAVGDVVARTTGADVDGFSKPYVAAVAYGSAVYGFLAIVLAILAARRMGYNAFAAAVAIWLGTPLLFYMYVAPPFSHACSAFGVALFTYVWVRVRGDWSVRGCAALGAAAALMAMIREQDVFFAAGPAVDFMWSRVSEPRAGPVRRSLGEGGRPEAGLPAVASAKAGGAIGVVAAIASFAVLFTPQIATYLILNGHLGPHSSVGRKMNWMAPHALQVLFSPEHGFFVWTPLALIAILGLVASAFRRKDHVWRCLLLTIALQIYVGGSVESWTVAGAYGQRRFIALTAAMVIGLASLERFGGADSARRPPARTGTMVRFGGPGAALRWFYACVVVLAVYWNLSLIAEFSIGLMDRQRLEPRKNAYDAFVTLPRQAPSLIYRYLFDRSSFYKARGGA